MPPKAKTHITCSKHKQISREQIVTKEHREKIGRKNVAFISMKNECCSAQKNMRRSED